MFVAGPSSSSSSVQSALTLPLTTLTASSSSSSSSSLCFSASVSAPSSSPAPPPAAPLLPGSVSLAKKETSTLKISPFQPAADPVFVTLRKLSSRPTAEAVTAPSVLSQPRPPTPHPPVAPVDVIQLKPSVGQGAEKGVKAAAVTTGYPGSENGRVRHKPVCPPTSTPVDPLDPKQELAHDPVDLDIICVDEEAGLVSTETPTTDVLELTLSSDTENSSDSSEINTEEEELFVSSQRLLHNVLEKTRREQLHMKFEALMKTVSLSEKMSKALTLKKAVKVIQMLRWTEMLQQRQIRDLKKRRDEYLSILVPSEERTNEDQIEVVDLLDVSDDVINISSDEDGVPKSTRTAVTQQVAAAASQVGEEEEEEEEEEEPQTGLLEEKSGHEVAQERLKRTSRTFNGKEVTESLCSDMKSSNSPETLPVDQQTQALQKEEPGTQRTDLDHMKEVSSASGEQEDRRPSEGGASATPPAGDAEHLQTPPISEIGVQLQPLSVPQSTLSFWLPCSAPAPRSRLKTVPNILSRSKTLTRQPSVTKATHGGSASYQALVTAEDPSLATKLSPAPPVVTLGPLMFLQTAPVPDFNNFLQLVRTESSHLPAVPPPLPPPVPVCAAEPDQTRDQDQDQNLLSSQALKPATSQSPGLATRGLLPAEPGPASGPGQPSGPGPASEPGQPSGPGQPLGPTPPSGPGQPSGPGPALGPGQPLGPVPASGPGQPLGPVPPPGPVPALGPVHPVDPGSASGPGPLVDPAPVSGPDGGREAETRNLSSLLDEMVFLNQQTVSMATATGGVASGKVGGAEDWRHAAKSPQLDSEVCNGHSETKAALDPGAVPAPPPLLHMKGGGAKAAGLSATDQTAVGGARGRGATWRPMPRLVPLGLRGNSPS